MDNVIDRIEHEEALSLLVPIGRREKFIEGVEELIDYNKSHCWCGMHLHLITYGDRDFPNCPLHGSAWKQNAEEIAARLPRPV